MLEQYSLSYSKLSEFQTLSNTLNPTELETIQSTYKLIVVSFEEHFKHLKELTYNKILSKKAKDLELYVIALLSSLKSLATAKNSIIVLRGLDPSLFSLLFFRLPLQEQWFAFYYPKCFFALLSLAKTFAETHNQFIAHSDLFIQNSTKSTFIIEVPTAKFLSHILTIVTILLRDCLDFMLIESQTVLINWLNCICICIGDLTKNLKNCVEINLLQETLLNLFANQKFSENVELAKTLIQIMNHFYSFDLLTDEKIAKTFGIKVLKFSEKLNSEQFYYLWNQIPPTFFISPTFYKLLNRINKQECLGGSKLSTFQFELLVNYFVDKIIPQFLFRNNSLNEWILDIVERFSSDLNFNKKISLKKSTEKTVLLFNQKWNLISAHFALFCVENRLKTPIGKAVQTFLKFESVVRELVTDVVASTKYNSDKSDIDLSLSRTEQLLRVRFTINFIDLLDKLMVYAVRGSMFNIAEISIGSKQFFQTNEHSCQGWMIRITPPLMSVCFAIGQYSQILRFTNNIFLDVERKYNTELNGKPLKIDSTFYLLLCYIVRALVELSAPKVISGIQRWTMKIFHVKMNWITYAKHLALGNFETALIGFCKVLTEEKLNDCVVKAIQEMSLKAILCLRNANFSSIYYEKLLKLNNNSSSNSENNCGDNLLYTKHQLDCIASLSSWNTTEENDETIKINKKSNIKSLCWNFQQSLENIELFALYNWLEYSSTNSQNKSDLRSEMQKLEGELMEISQLIFATNYNENSLIQVKAAALKAIFYLIKDQRKLNFNNSHTKKQSNKFKKDSIDIEDFSKFWETGKISHRIEIGQMICTWLNRLLLQNLSNNKYSLTKFTLKAQQLLLNAHDKLSNLANKTGNINLSQFHLFEYSKLINLLNNNIQTKNINNFNVKFNSELNQTTTIWPNNNYWQMPSNTINNNFICSDYLLNNDEFSTNKIGNNSIIVKNFLKLNDTVSNLKMFLRTEKITWNLNNTSTIITNNNNNNNKSENEKLKFDSQTNNFRNMIDVLCTHLNASSTYSFERDKVLSKMSICLGDWSKNLPSSINLLLQKQASAPHSFLQQVLQSYEYLESYCVGINSPDLLKGSFYSVAQNIAPKNSNSYKAMLDWSMDQLFVSFSFYNSEKNSTEYFEDVLRISLNELALFRKMSINLSNNKGYKFLTLLSKCSNLDEFKASALIEFSEDASIINSINMFDFEQIWLIIKRRQYKLFEISLTSCINFIENISTPKFNTLNISISICLIILKMLTTQPEWFSKIFEYNWIVRTNANIWKEVITQLFAKLNNQNNFVRETVLCLLEKISELFPHKICYPAIVNSGLLSINIDINDETLYDCNNIISFNNKQNKNDKNLSFQVDNCLLMQKSCRRLVKYIKNRYPKMINDVWKFCCEMQKINLLFEEKWLFVLTNLDIMIIRRLQKIEKEPNKMHLTDKRRIEFFNEKKETILTLVYQILNDLYESTCNCTQLETVNEKQFCLLYKSLILQAIKCFYENRNKLEKAWEPFKELIESMSTRAMKRNALFLYTHEISSYLSSLTTSSIPIPGQEFCKYSPSTIVTISKMHKTIYVLPTKTRPKKITFVGSNGKEYSFLFKGHENLHLDERVMQVLRVCNIMLTNDEMGDSSCSIYSVTPLGPRSGLIQWIEGATPLFQIYRKWKIRELEDRENKRIQEESKLNEVSSVLNGKSKTTSNHHKKNSENNTTFIEEIPQKLEPKRPIELFFSKLKAIFSEEKISDESLRNRQSWPVSCLEKAHLELVKVTPRDILSKELWMKSGNSSTWWRVTEQFSRSAAVMSAIGSIIGLGDRHLDNFLVNMTTGQVVHVDYNICFEKGKTLRVPETVPFRLTGNIIHALGPTQIEGTFRETFIDVLTTLRSNKKILLSIFDSFVSDSLVDWTIQEQSNPFELNLALLYAIYGTVNHEELKIKTADNNEIKTQKFNNILSRIYHKLNGQELIENFKNKDLQNNENLTINETAPMKPTEQVDFLIECATNITNLALLYEGWTSWV